jgi:hypothetical protein
LPPQAVHEKRVLSLAMAHDTGYNPSSRGLQGKTPIDIHLTS